MTATGDARFMKNEELWSIYHDTGKRYRDMKYAVLEEMSKRLNYKVVMPASVVIPEFRHWKMNGGQEDRY